MEYDQIDDEKIVSEVVAAEEQGKLRPAKKRETMEIRLAALSAIVHEMQESVKNEKEDDGKATA